MAQFKTEDRLPEDSRILRVGSLKEFALFSKRDELGFKGIVFDYGITPTFASAVDNYQREARGRDCNIIKHKSEGINNNFHVGKIVIDGQDAFYDFEGQTKQTFFNSHSIGSKLGMAWIELTEAFFISGNYNSVMSIIRDSAYHPQQFHSHDPTLVMALNNEGTVIKKPDGTEYSTKMGEVLIVDDGVVHKAPEYDPSKPIRTTIIAYGL